MIDILIASVAGPQCGLFDRDQWFAQGGTDRQLSWRLATGALTDEGPGVYGLPGWSETFMRGVWRGHLLAGRHSAASQETAAAVHRLWPFPQGALVFSVPHGDHHRPRGAIVRQPRDLTEDQIVVVNGMRVTSIPRTFCDLAASSSRARLSRGLEQAHLDGKSKISETVALYERLRKPGKPGFKTLGEILEVRRPDFYIPPTELEKMFRQLLRRYGLPEPIWQPPLPWDPRRRADGLWLPQNVLLELDSRSWHARIDQMTADRRRDRDAKRHGLPLYRFTYEEVRYKPQAVADDVADLLSRAA
jgi:hypothetical protein